MKRLAAAVLLACAVCAAHAKPPAPEASFPLEPYRTTIALRATVGGREGLFVVDTAGGLTTLTPGFAESIGCAPWGRVTGFRMMGDRLDVPRCDDVEVTIGGRGFRASTTGVFDLMSLYPADAQPVAGLIALDLFDGKAITIDFPGKRLIVESAASLRARTKRAQELPVRLSREVQGRALAASVGVPTSRGLVWMEIDSGNGGTILVSKPYASLFGLDPTKDGPQAIDVVLGGNLRMSGRAFTPDMIIDGNVGMPFLKDVAITLDLAAGRLWVTRASN